MALPACLFALSGCVTGDAVHGFHPIAVWYDVAAAGDFTIDASAAWDADFQTLRRLGFDTVFLHRSGGTDLAPVVASADAHGLHVAVLDAEADYYVRNGRIPPGHLSLGSLAAQCRHSPAAIVRLGLVTDAASAERVRRLAARLHPVAGGPRTHVSIAPSADVNADSLGVTLCSPMPIVTFDRAHAPSPDPFVGNMAAIRATRRETLDFPEVSSLLLTYHKALASGQVAGVIFDQFRGSLDGWRGVVDSHGQLSAGDSAAIKRITERARQWGPRLQRTIPMAIPLEGASDGSLEVVAFVGAKRRYVMLINASLDRFFRSPIEVTRTLDDPPASRLVRVPTRGATVVGEVYPVRRGRVTLTTNLAPGDACLFEVF